MQILYASQMQEWEAFTIDKEKISSLILMERAAQLCTKFLIENDFAEGSMKIFCGKGNNGGDGLVIARQLIVFGFHPVVYIIEFGSKGTPEFQENLQKLHDFTSDIHYIQSAEFFPFLDKNDIVVDALFGIGLNRPLQDLSASLVQHINDSGAKIISIDLPSGMPLEKSCAKDIVIKAAHTLTFQCLKLCFLMPENAAFFGEVKVLNIELHKDFLKTVEATFELTEEEKIRKIYKPRKSFSHKGTFGHALLIAGGKGKMGAAIIASKACLRTGAGLLTLEVKEENLNLIHGAIPEAMCMVKSDDNEFDKFSSIGIGPGIGTGEDSVKQLYKVFNRFNKPFVIDADALNILASNKAWFDIIGKNAVLTPHPKEFERLFNASENDFATVNKAIELSKQYSFTIVLKGHYTLIAQKGKGYFNTTGNAGMATGGSGDMLTGVITSLLAQKYEPLDAAILGVYLHGLSADIALEQQSQESLLPSDMIEYLGKAFQVISFK